MTMEDNNNIKSHQARPGNVPRNHVRGSSLLLSGRFLAMALNLLTQILIVRYLSKTDYGMFAYAITLVTIATTVNCLGMERAVERFVPIYEEKNDLASAAGVLILAIGILVNPRRDNGCIGGWASGVVSRCAQRKFGRNRPSCRINYTGPRYCP